MTATNISALRQIARIRLTLRTRSTPGRLRHARARLARLSRRLTQ